MRFPSTELKPYEGHSCNWVEKYFLNNLFPKIRRGIWIIMILQTFDAKYAGLRGCEWPTTSKAFYAQ